jgi:kynureninase
VLKHGFGRFFESLGARIDCTAHSHHPWPDCALAAHTQYADDSMRRTNRKWDKVFGDVVPQAQAHIAREIGWAEPAQIAFAPNTHEFVLRMISCFNEPGPQRILCSAHEFHSFARQAKRLEEAGSVEVVRVGGEPWPDFNARFIAAARAQQPHLIWLSQVFFDSGFVVTGLKALMAGLLEAAPDALVVIDGYHAFCALPVEAADLGPNVFYLAGGYKYAMAGEGACWLAAPSGAAQRPQNTGWFADFGARARPQGGPIEYADDGMRFFGATFDASGLYRFNAVRDWLAAEGVNTAMIHHHVKTLQQRFLQGLGERNLPGIGMANLIPGTGVARGNFLTFDTHEAQAIEARLEAAGIDIDQRGTRLRFGFGVYHDAAMIDALLTRLDTVLG